MGEQNGKGQGIYLKSSSELAIMRRGGKLLHRIMHELGKSVHDGMTTAELDKLAMSLFKKTGGRPAFLGQYGFPASLCISINEEVVHGIPGKRKMRDGDLVSIDGGLILDGFYTDSAITVPIGKVSDKAKQLLQVTREALKVGIAAARYEGRVGDIGAAIEKYVRGNGFYIADRLTGHGVGRYLHEDPSVYNTAAERGPRIGNGLTIAIEPMVNVGTDETAELKDKWTVVTADRSLSAHFEHTVAITKDGLEILTLDPEVASEL